MKKILAILFVASMCATFTGCGSDATSDESGDTTDTLEEETYTYDTGFPSVELTKYVPEPTFGDISYYDYVDSLIIYVENATEEDVDEYISSLDSYGWNLNVSDENSDNSFFASNEYNQSIYVNLYDTTMTISLTSD